jgi:hypothetical protein
VVESRSSFPWASVEAVGRGEEMLASGVEDVETLAEQFAEAWSSAVGLACHSDSSSSAVAGLVAAGPEPVPAPVVGSSAEDRLDFDASFLVAGLTLLRPVFCIHPRIVSNVVWYKLSN